jgi:two-component system chemotaxis response regulator CheB
MSETARVLIVDDSRVFRAALEEALAGQDGVQVVGSVYSGARALEFLRTSVADLVTLDVEMPGMDGLETLNNIQKLNAGRPPGEAVGVIMVSAFTRKGADVTVRALAAGAHDFVTKPSGPDAAQNMLALRTNLLTRIRSYLVRRRAAPAAPAERLTSSGIRRIIEPLLPARTRPARAIVVAVSTGGPRALEVLLPDLCERTELPVLVVQHMPPTFTASLAENLGRLVPHSDVAEAADGELLRPRTVRIAPGDRHLVLRATGGQLVTGLTDQPKENGFRPSADVLFRSASATLGGDVVAVVLTGMGNDGTEGLRPLKRAGGAVVAQDEATSVVWGMPGSAVAAGLADTVVPLERVAAAVAWLAAGRRGA